MLVSTKIKTLGLCLVDTYRSSGDLYDNIDIVKQQSDGTFPRPADARYGVDIPDYPYCLDGTNDEVKGLRHSPVYIVIKIQVFSVNGHTETIKTVIGDGEIILHRPV